MTAVDSAESRPTEDDSTCDSNDDNAEAVWAGNEEGEAEEEEAQCDEEEAEVCENNSHATSEDEKEDEDALGGERHLELSSDDDDDEASFLRNARGLLVYAAAAYIPQLRRSYEDRCTEMFPQLEASAAERFEQQIASFREAAVAAGQTHSLATPEEMGFLAPLSVRPLRSAEERGGKSASAADKKNKKGQALQPYSVADLYAPLPSDEHERRRFQFVASILIPPWVKVEESKGSALHFFAPDEILQCILGDKECPTPTSDLSPAVAVTAEGVASEGSDSTAAASFDTQAKSMPNLLNISTLSSMTAVVQYGCHRGERPVFFDPSNTWPHYEGGWTKDRLSASKNPFLNAKFEANDAKAAFWKWKWRQYRCQCAGRRRRRHTSVTLH